MPEPKHKNQWIKFKDDFNNMTDEKIDRELERAQREVDEYEEFIEAVVAWKADGKPRNQ